MYSVTYDCEPTPSISSPSIHPSICFLSQSSDPPPILLLSICSLGVHIDYNVDRISYDDFINRELILFSHAGASLSLINLQYSASCNTNLILSLLCTALHCLTLLLSASLSLSPLSPSPTCCSHPFAMSHSPFLYLTLPSIPFIRQ